MIGELPFPHVSAVRLGPFSWKAYISTHYFVDDGPVEFGHDIRVFVAIKCTRSRALRAARAELGRRPRTGWMRPVARVE
jgi:hypothetical protein